jgi:Domain of unknown function (DUF4388)
METQGRILDGNLETLGLQATLKMLALSGKTGVLTVASGQERLATFLESGHIVDLDEPSTSPLDIVDMFRLLGRLNQVPRAQVLELRRLSGANPSTAMAIMVQWGLMSPAELQQRTEFRVIQAISRAVRWERGRFEFHRDISALHSRVSPQRPLNVDHVLLEALRMADEWGNTGAFALSRGTVARWMPEPQFRGDVSGLNLTPDEIHVLCLSNGQFPLHAISTALMIPESRVASMMQKLLGHGLIEVVDARLETELERSLVNLLTQSQHQLSQDNRPSPEYRMLVLMRTMGNCINGLLAHHATFARVLRGRGELPAAEVARYLDSTFGPMLAGLQREYPRMEEIVRFTNGRLDVHDVETLDRVVKGHELVECLWDAVSLFRQLMQRVFDRLLADEVGKSRVGRQFEDLWAAFLREIDEEIERQSSRRVATRVQTERAVQGRPRAEAVGGVPFEYELAPDSRRRFS